MEKMASQDIFELAGAVSWENFNKSDIACRLT